MTDGFTLNQKRALAVATVIALGSARTSCAATCC